MKELISVPSEVYYRQREVLWLDLRKPFGKQEKSNRENSSFEDCWKRYFPYSLYIIKCPKFCV